jgi:hypothetical protein
LLGASATPFGEQGKLGCPFLPCPGSGLIFTIRRSTAPSVHKIVVVDLAEGIFDVISSTIADAAVTGVNPSLSG